MKTLTINVSEKIYFGIQEESKKIFTVSFPILTDREFVPERSLKWATVQANAPGRNYLMYTEQNLLAF